MCLYLVSQIESHRHLKMNAFSSNKWYGYFIDLSEVKWKMQCWQVNSNTLLNIQQSPPNQTMQRTQTMNQIQINLNQKIAATQSNQDAPGAQHRLICHTPRLPWEANHPLALQTFRTQLLSWLPASGKKMQTGIMRGTRFPKEVSPETLPSCPLTDNHPRAQRRPLIAPIRAVINCIQCLNISVRVTLWVLIEWGLVFWVIWYYLMWNSITVGKVPCHSH